MPYPIDSPEYWIEEFKPTAAELDGLYEFVLDAARPFTANELARELVRRHVELAVTRRRSKSGSGSAVYSPSDRYEPKQRVTFPALGSVDGVVKATRPGNNAEYGEYQVIQVEIDGATREFAAGLAWQHPLMAVDPDTDPDALAARYDALVAPGLAALLASDNDWLHLDQRWVLRALLPTLNAGHLNLAEAILMLAGEPLPSEQVLRDLDLDESVPLPTRTMALDAALGADPRFRNVGALESPLWTVTAQPS